MDQANQQNAEGKWYQFWEDQRLFKSDPNSSKPHYSLIMPPPNLTGELHMGHAMQHSILDAIARFKRLQGFDVLLLPGVDHAGIQFESTFTKKLAKENLSKHSLGREEWLARAWQFREEVYASFHATWTVFGISADWSKEVFTLEPKMQQAVVEEFKRFWEQDLLYKGAYIVQWCPKDQTAIEDVEMEYLEKTEKLYYINYKIAGSDQVITVATARPETIAADVAIAVYPNHPQFSSLVGEKALNPFTNSLIPIIEDQRVEKDFGTGALKITPGHDLLDYVIGQDHNLEILHAVSKDGRITDLDSNLVGLKVIEAREKAAQKLQELGLLDKTEEYTHSVPICERCKTTVEPLISEEWFVKMKPLAEKALTHIKEINFVPENYDKIISDWLENIHDWSISRSLWWGHQIPVWYCQKCNPTHQVGKNKDMVISLNHPKQNCQTCQLNEWVQDEQVLDTWFSSGLWPIATLGWPRLTIELQKYFPWDFNLSAPEIKYLWIARMIMLSLWFEDQISFKNMFFHGTMRDLQGRKMSKSLGNGVDPLELIKQWGVDATRMTLYSYSTPGRDPKASKQTMDERCKNFRNFATKLRNITKFIIDLNPSKENPASLVKSQSISSSTQSKVKQEKFTTGAENTDVIPADLRNSSSTPQNNKQREFSHHDDKVIIETLDQTIKQVTRNIDEFNLHLATEAIYAFVWHQFADVYIEKSKSRRKDAQACLEYILEQVLKLLHPFMPFLSEELYQKLPDHEKSIMLAHWPAN